MDIVQCASLDSASLVIYPEIKATEVKFSTSVVLFQDNLMWLVKSKETHYYMQTVGDSFGKISYTDVKQC